MSGRTWKSQNIDLLQQIKSRLLETDGMEVEVKNAGEVWRIRVDDSVFIAFRNGTLYHTPSNSNSARVAAASQLIDSVSGTGYLPPDKDILIGLDETGKGEIAGPVVLAGVIFPKTIFDDIVRTIGPADTKKQHRPEYWDELFGKLNEYRKKSFYFVTENISPRLFDKYNVNHLLDLFYSKIIRRLQQSVPGRSCRIVIDDYGAAGLKNSDLFRGGRENELVILTQAEDRYIEAKAASLIAKGIREKIMHYLNELQEFRIDGISVGAGNVGNETTLQWLHKWHAAAKPYPWFIKKSFKTIKEITGDSADKKGIPILKTESLPPEFVQSFQQGESPKHLTSIECNNCNQWQQTLSYNSGDIVCASCSQPIDDLRLTLRYYCGSILIDNPIVEMKMLRHDLEGGAFFENYRVIIPWSDSSKNNRNFREGVQELKKLQRLGRLDLKYVKLDSQSQNDLYSILTNMAVESHSIILTPNPGLIDKIREQDLLSIYYQDSHSLQIDMAINP